MSSSMDWEAFYKLPKEEQDAYWAAEHQKDLEEDFQEFLTAPFESLRNKYHSRLYNREDAVALQSMLEERLGMKDPEGEIPEEGWRRSNWCSG